jgi:NAD+ synthase (glutamine-hydrolysing)
MSLVTMNATVGDLEKNLRSIVHRSHQAKAVSADIVVFPEMAITGYPNEDLTFRKSYIQASEGAVNSLASRLQDEGIGDVVVMVGYLRHSDSTLDVVGRPKGSPLNAAAIIHSGRMVGEAFKHCLPNYGVHDERRYFVPGRSLQIVQINDVNLALMFGHDLLEDDAMVQTAHAAGADLLLAIAAIPYERETLKKRLTSLTRLTEETGCATAFVNLCGGQDEVIFDGDAIVLGADADLTARSEAFSDRLLTVDLRVGDSCSRSVSGRTPSKHIRVDHTAIKLGPTQRTKNAISREIAPTQEIEAETYAAISLCLHDFVRKGNIGHVYVNMLGDANSSLVAAIASDALGCDRVSAVVMEFASPDGAAAISRHSSMSLGIEYVGLSADVLQACKSSLGETFTGDEGNLRARLQGIAAMAVSNSNEPSIVLAAFDKTDIALGTPVLYGGSVGAFAPLRDVFKTEVLRLAEWRNQLSLSRNLPIPIPSGLLCPPSLQRSTEVDGILRLYVEASADIDDLESHGYDRALAEVIIRRVVAAEFKRRQYPIGPRITRRAFGRDWRVPITKDLPGPL